MDNLNEEIYLDANATTRILLEAANVMDTIIGKYPLNPSSPHRSGEIARQYLTEARDRVSLLFGDIDSDDLIFTSGGTEGNWLAISSFRNCISKYIISTSIEHASVFEPVTRLGRHKLIGVDSNGMIEVGQLIDEIKTSHELPMISIQLANSETGVIQPILDIISEIRATGSEAFIHVDAAQAIGRLTFDVKECDFVTCSAHKLHGPHGIGLLYISERAQEKISSCFVGAGQEKKWRSGTVNVPGAVGAGVAFEARYNGFDSQIDHMRYLRDAFENKIVEQLQNAKINAFEAIRVPNTSNITFFGIDGMQLLAKLDAQGVQASMGSACSSAKPEPSMVLRSMGLSDKDAFSTLRFSVSVQNTINEIERAVEIICSTVKG